MLVVHRLVDGQICGTLCQVSKVDALAELVLVMQHLLHLFATKRAHRSLFLNFDRRLRLVELVKDGRPALFFLCPDIVVFL